MQGHTQGVIVMYVTLMYRMTLSNLYDSVEVQKGEIRFFHPLKMILLGLKKVRVATYVALRTNVLV